MRSDLVIMLVVLSTLCFLSPVYATLRRIPRLQAGSPPPLEVGQRRYERMIPWVWTLRFVALAATIAFLIQAVARRDEDSREITTLIPIVIWAFVAGLIVAAVLSALRERDLLREVPALGPGQPLVVRLVAVSSIALPAALLTVGLLDTDFIVSGSCIIAAVVAGKILRKVAESLTIRTRTLVEPESDTGRTIAEAISKFGFVPKRIVQIPQMIANAWAFKDGSVVFSSASRAILTDDELAAVIAHELSHVKHRDVRKIGKAQAQAFIGLLVFLAASGVPADLAADLPGLIAGMIGAMILTFPLVRWWIARTTQPLAFRCDREARDLGYGDHLASALVKLYRYGGMPTRWRGLDARWATHPSLEDRLQALAPVALRRATSA